MALFGTFSYKLASSEEPPKKFFFELQKQILSFWPSVEAKLEAPSGFVNVTGAKIVDTPNTLVLELRIPTSTGEQIHLFQFPSLEEKYRWNQGFKTALILLAQPQEEEIPILPAKKMEGPKTLRFGDRTIILPPPPPLPAMFDRQNLEIDAQSSEIISGTFEKLVECLFDGNFGTPQFMSSFLLTYRIMGSSSQLLKEISTQYAKYKGEWNKPARLRILNFMRKWIIESSNDFTTDPKFWGEFASFIEKNNDEPIITTSIKQKLQTLKTTGTPKNMTKSYADKPPEPISPKVIYSTLTFDDIVPLEFARQLSLIQFQQFYQIESKELLSFAWLSQDKAILTPHLTKITEDFNRLSNWVSYTMLAPENEKKRPVLFSKFIKIMEECKKLNNFNTLFSIMSAFSKVPVFRLIAIFSEGITTESKKAFEEISEFCSPNRNWKVYRETIRKINPPLIPFMGLYQTDLTFINEGVRNVRKNGLWNFKKCVMTANLAKEVQLYQQQSYNLITIPLICKYYDELLSIGAKVEQDKLMELSLKILPKEKPAEPGK